MEHNIIILHPRQQKMVSKAVEAIHQYGNTLCVAPTGAGKTIIKASIVGNLINEGAKALVLQHRHELLHQNRQKFGWVNPHCTTSIFNASQKNFDAQVTFAMVPTLQRHTDIMPYFDIIAIDEAHHAVTETFRKIIDQARNVNPHLKLLGLTATPNRGDGLNLGRVFNNVGDQIYLRELIADGTLVPPRTFVIDLGCQDDLSSLYGKINTKGSTRKDFAGMKSEIIMEEAARILNTEAYCQEVVRHWKRLSEGRKTVVFCTTVKHAKAVQEAFLKEGISATHVNGKMPLLEREDRIREFTEGNAQVITNISVFTEGWDYPPTSCVILLRPTSYKSTMIQMIGRGLRSCQEKQECLILDFGLASRRHGSLEQIVDLEPDQGEKKVGTKSCPGCDTILPKNTRECPLCGFSFSKPKEKEEKIIESNEPGVELTELDITKQSDFQWEYVNEQTMACTGFNAFAVVLQKEEGEWTAIGKKNHGEKYLLKTGRKEVCLSAADCFMSQIEQTKSAAKKGNRWLNNPPTEKQISCLKDVPRELIRNSYHASVLINYKNHKALIDNVMNGITEN